MTREDSSSSVGSVKKTVTFAVAEVLCYDPPISCQECGMEFPSNSLLKDHQERSHQREWVKGSTHIENLGNLMDKSIKVAVVP